jgi:ABC-type multidrug transport system ATPase subunit
VRNPSKRSFSVARLLLRHRAEPDQPEPPNEQTAADSTQHKPESDDQPPAGARPQTPPSKKTTAQPTQTTPPSNQPPDDQPPSGPAEPTSPEKPEKKAAAELTESETPSKQPPSEDDAKQTERNSPQRNIRTVGRLLSHRREPTESLTIGRSPGSDIMIDDQLASPLHAILVPTATGLEIHDKNSSKGTFVNGERIGRGLLHEGDVVTIGNADFEVSDTTLVPRPASATGGVETRRLNLAIDGHQILTDVSFSARPGTVTAVIGPPGAGKSSLTKLLGGATRPSAGDVTFEGHNVDTEYAVVRSRIGMVPQYDALHHQLTVEQALRYAAELRLPADNSATERRQVVDQVVDELKLTPCRTKRVDELSSVQHKHLSVAMELLTTPSLLILDEPAFRLAPSLSGQVMTMARRLADAGRVVVVVTHSRDHVNLCEQVMLLNSSGKTAYVGPPDQITAAMGTTSWADMFATVSKDADGAHNGSVARQQPSTHPTPPQSNGPARTNRRQQANEAPHRQDRPRDSRRPAARAKPARLSVRRQLSSVARRQVRLIAGDRGYLTFLAVAPFILGALSLAVPGRGNPDRAAETLIMLIVAAVVMGTALGIRDPFEERAVFRRERSAGLSASAYLAAKVAVFSLAAIIQTAILTAIVVVGGGALAHDTTSLGEPIARLYVVVATTAIVSVIVGLGVSSLARRGEYLPLAFATAVTISLVLCGGVVPFLSQILSDQIASCSPSPCAPTASASPAGWRAIETVDAHDQLWTHSTSWWVLDVALLMLFGAVSAGFVHWRLRRPSYGRHPFASDVE